MNRKMTHSLALLLLFATVMPPAATVAAAEEGGTGVDAVSATKSGGVANVTGTATFVDVPTLVGTDPVGDSKLAGIGTDFVEAVIAKPDPFGDTLRFTASLFDQPEGLWGIPEAVCYAWRFEVGSEVHGVHGFRTKQALDPGNLEPSFVLDPPALVPRLSSTDPLNSGVRLNGVIENGVVEFFLPMAVVGAEPGTALGTPESWYVAAVTNPLTPALNCNSGDGKLYHLDDMTPGGSSLQYTVPEATVKLGIAPAGTPASAIPLTADADVGSDGGFLGSIFLAGKPAGDYVILARACYGAGNCGEATTNVRI